VVVFPTPPFSFAMVMVMAISLFWPPEMGGCIYNTKYWT
jgi:hypothetical protein